MLKHLNNVVSGFVRFLKYLFFNLLRFFKRPVRSGSIIIEALLALAIGSAILTAVSTALVTSQQANLQSSQYQQAQLYIQEAEEAVRSLWLSGWNNLNLTGVFHPEVSVDDWQMVVGDESLGIYSRQVEIDEVFRDLDGNIATAGGTLDPSTKKITTTVSWEIPRPKAIAHSFFIARYKDNLVWFEDTAEDFADGTEDATDATINPGYVQLAETGGEGGWTEPTVIKYVDAVAKANGIWAEEGYLYLALKSSGSDKVEVFDIAADPETPASLGAFDAAAEINNIAVAGDYLYAAIFNDVSSGIQIFDISVDPVNPTAVGTSSTGGVPSGLWIQNGYLFASMVVGKKVEVYDLTDPLEPAFQGSFNTSDNTVDISGSGNYIYVAQETKSKGVEVFDISESVTSPTSEGIMTTFYDPRGIWIESNTMYLVLTGKRAAMYTLTFNPINPTLLGIFNLDQNGADITALGDYGYIGGKDSWKRAIGVIYVGDSKGESGIYFVYGEYISSTLDAVNQAAFNRISWEGNEAAGTDILFQIATNDDDLTWNFVGPDGTAGSYFEEPGAVPLNSILARYFRYKIILTGDGDVTPTVDNVTVNYSP